MICRTTVIRRTLVITVFFSVCQTWAIADPLPTAISYLNRMGEALRNLNYYGTIVYMHDGQIESMQIIHKKDASGEYERLVHLSGEPREVIRNNDVVTCYLPDSELVFVGRRNKKGHLLAKLNADFQPFLNTYTFSIDGQGRVAGKSVHVISINPKDSFRYGYKLWLSQENALLLKSELVSSKGDVLEQLMFAQIDVVEFIPSSKLKPAISGDGYTWHKEKAGTNSKSQVNPGWTVKNFPVGFKLTEYSKQQMPNSEVAADHMVISDGLASISVYIEPFGVESQPFVGASHMGAVSVYGAVVGDHQVTVVGEVPESTVKMIATSVVPKSVEVARD